MLNMVYAMNMIEQVARALARLTLTEAGQKAFDYDVNYFKAAFAPSEQIKFLVQAKAAIEAMREPTEEMLKAGDSSVVYTKDLYQSMIDAALKE